MERFSLTMKVMVVSTHDTDFKYTIENSGGGRIAVNHNEEKAMFRSRKLFWKFIKT